MTMFSREYWYSSIQTLCKGEWGDAVTLFRDCFGGMCGSCFPVESQTQSPTLEREEKRVTDDWVIDEIYHHYGAKVAMYFAFTEFYTRRLLILVYIGCALYFSIRFVDWSLWMQVV